MTVYTDFTKRAQELGWSLSGLTVRGYVTEDPDTDPTTDSDSFTAAHISAFEAGDWEYVSLILEAVDSRGVVWGVSSLCSVASGDFPITDEHGTVTGEKTLTPLSDASYTDDLIGEALNSAASELYAYTLPEVHEP